MIEYAHLSVPKNNEKRPLFTLLCESLRKAKKQIEPASSKFALEGGRALRAECGGWGLCVLDVAMCLFCKYTTYMNIIV